MDIQDLIAQMQGRYDDQGYYGLNDSERDSAIASNYNAIGSNLLAGVASGSWGGITTGIARGLAAGNEAEDKALADASTRNLNATANALKYAHDMTDLEKSALDLKAAKEDHDQKLKTRDLTVKLWNENKVALTSAIDKIPDGDVKEGAKRKLKLMDFYMGSMQIEKAAALGDQIEAEVPGIQEHVLDMMGRSEAAKTAATTRGKLSAIDEHNKTMEGKSNLVADPSGLLRPATDIEMRELSSKEAITNAQVGSIKAQTEYNQARAEYYSNGGHVSPSKIGTEVKRATDALGAYNAVIDRVSATPSTSDQMFNVRLTSDKDYTKFEQSLEYLRSLGIPVDGKHPVKDLSQDKLRALVAGTMNANARAMFGVDRAVGGGGIGAEASKSSIIYSTMMGNPLVASTFSRITNPHDKAVAIVQQFIAQYPDRKLGDINAIISEVEQKIINDSKAQVNGAR